jgi:hypothetical protein
MARLQQGSEGRLWLMGRGSRKEAGLPEWFTETIQYQVRWIVTDVPNMVLETPELTQKAVCYGYSSSKLNAQAYYSSAP